MPNKTKTDTSEVEKKEDVETKETGETQDSTSTIEETELENGSEDEKVDYRELAEAERQRREKAERALAESAFKDRRERKEKEAGEEDNLEMGTEGEDRPLTKKDLQILLAQERQNTEKRIQENRAIEIVKKLTSSEDEADYIMQLHRNRQWPEYLSLEEQLEEAHAIANKKKLLAKNSELMRALRSRDGVSRDTASSYRDSDVGTGVKMNASDKASYERAGFKYDAKQRLWLLKLPSGKTLAKDHRTGVTKLLD